MKLSILEYMKYLGGSNTSKCVVEGENVLNAGHLILAGKTHETSDAIEIYGLCLQSSALESNPHEITGKLSVSSSVNVDKMLCSCKAGNSGKCKHVSAFLVKCIREDIELLEYISQTDRKCVWSTQKNVTKDKYRPVCVDAMPCLKDKVTHSNVIVDYAEVLDFFCNRVPASSVARHREGRRPENRIDVCTDEQGATNTCHNNSFSEILNNSSQSILMMYLASIKVPAQRDCCAQLLINLFNEDIETIINTPQHSSEWKKIRKYRITGSRCYEIFTYSKNDWKTKALKYFNPIHFTNKYIKHGLKFESTARDIFIKISKMNVIECGLVVPVANKWLGYSPDGIIFFEDKPLYLLEIKFIFEGKNKTILDAITNVKYVVEENGQHKIRKQHKYYGQIQMGMAVLNLSKTYFILYASYDDSVLVMEIDFDF